MTEDKKRKEKRNAVHSPSELFALAPRLLFPSSSSSSSYNQKQQVIQAERLILKELGFNVHTKHSHKLVVTYCTLIGVDSINKECVNLAWNYMNDGHRTDVFVRYKRKKEKKRAVSRADF